MRILRQHIGRCHEWYWAPLVYILGVCFLYWEVLLGEQGFGWDTIETYWPDLVFATDQLADGTWPWWNPYDRGGYPFSADPQGALLYPVQWLFAGIGVALGETPWWLIQAKILFHHVVAGLCLHAFLRHRDLPPLAAIVGGIVLIASCPWLIHKASNLLMPLAWAPLIWLATDRLCDRPGWQQALFLAFSLYLAGSAGSPPGFFYTLASAILYGSFRVAVSAVDRKRHGELSPFVRRLIPTVIAAGLLTCGLLWFGVFSGLELTNHSLRAQRTLGYALSSPLPLWPTLKGLFAPPVGHIDAYCGAIAMILAILGIVVRPRADEYTPLFFLAGAAFFLALSFGDQTPLLPWLATHVPGFDLWRLANRYKCVFAPMLAVLAAYGMTNLLRLPLETRDTRRIIVIVLGCVVLVLYLLFANPITKATITRFPPLYQSIIWLLVGAGYILTSRISNRYCHLLLAVLPILLISDPIRYLHHRDSAYEARVDHLEDRTKIEGLGGVLDHTYRVYDEYALEQRSGTRLSIRDFRGYPSGDPLEFARYRDVLKRSTQNPELLEAYNVRYILHGPHRRNGKRANYLKVDPARSTPAHYEAVGATVRASKHPVALVEWYGAVRIVATDKVLDAVLAAEDSEGKRHYAVMEKEHAQKLGSELPPQIALGANGPPSVPGTLREFGTNRIVAEINAPSPGLVVLNEAQYPGWRVLVDGAETASTTANYLLRAVRVDKGHHVIEWRYETPQRLEWFMYLASLCLLCLGTISAIAIRALRGMR